MINGTPPSQLFLIQQHQTKHRRTLESISQTDCRADFNLAPTFVTMMNTKKVNHENWKRFARKRTREQILRSNQKLFDRLIGISMEQGPYSRHRSEGSPMNTSGSLLVENSKVSQTSIREASPTASSKQSMLHHNIKLENIRRCRAIDSQNPEIAKRIMQKTGELSHARDLRQFQNTRKILNRINKFEHLKRISTAQQESVKFRTKTLPVRDITSSSASSQRHRSIPKLNFSKANIEKVNLDKSNHQSANKLVEKRMSDLRLKKAP